MSADDLPVGEDLDQALLGVVHAHGRALRRARIVLYAGASLLSEAQRRMTGADLSAMPAMGEHDSKEQPGAATVADLERMAADLACRTFGAGWADARLPSCTIANLAAFSFLARPGELMLAPAARDGGHLSQRRGGTPSAFGLRVEDLAFDVQGQCLDAEAAATQVDAARPRLVMLGRSVVLGPDRLACVTEAARRVGAVTIYDASHVAGLIAAKVFDDPLAAGIDVITTSTYKTLRGPPGSIVLFRDPERGRAFSRHVDADFLANQDASRLPAIISALSSCRPAAPYGRRVLAVADRLKARFARRGASLLLPDRPAASHQVVMRLGPPAASRVAMSSLEAGGVLVGTCAIPGHPNESGLRFGSQVVASLGLDDTAVDRIAEVTYDLLEAAGHGAERLGSDHPACRKALDEVRVLLGEAAPRCSGRELATTGRGPQ